MTLDDQIINECSACKGANKYCPIRDTVKYSSINQELLEQLTAVEGYRKRINNQKTKELGIPVDIGIDQAYMSWVNNGYAKKWRLEYNKLRKEL